MIVNCQLMVQLIGLKPKQSYTYTRKYSLVMQGKSHSILDTLDSEALLR